MGSPKETGKVRVSRNPDEPTRRLRVAGRRDVAYVSDEALWREHIYDRLRSLTTAVTLVAIVAVAALGVGLWALLADPRDDTDRLRRIEQRIEQLEAQQRPATDDLAAVRQRQQALDERLRALEDQADEPAAETEAMIEAIESTQQSVAQLEQRVADLEQAAP
jgi:uncharacterized protein HemX